VALKPWKTAKHRLHSLAALGCALLLAGCGGGGSSAVAPPTTNVPAPITGQSDQAYLDPVAYSGAADASLAGAEEHAAVHHAHITLGGSDIAYTATSGHLNAVDLRAGTASASFFYVAYTGDGQDAAKRPLTFFYNGGPGSASLWLHLGSFGPKRIVTNVPSTMMPVPTQLVDNAESLLDTSDLVFVDAIGTGYSQAIAPNTNQTFWGTDNDAAAFRDFVRRYLEVNHRQQSPLFLYGESYGGPRTAVLANLLEQAGVELSGIMLQSPILDYNSNCGVFEADSVSCEGYVPSYSAIGAYHQLSNPAPADLGAFIAQVEQFDSTAYRAAVAAFIRNRTAAPADVVAHMAAFTGLPPLAWQRDFDLGPHTVQTELLSERLTGRYDARMVAPVGSALAADGDPALTAIASTFSNAVPSYLSASLKYSALSTYISSSNNINRWDFSHDGKSLPNTIPDLAEALLHNPALKILAMGGYYDLATPVYLTEEDLARLGVNANIRIKRYQGGHMSYLDNSVRVLQKADLRSFYDSAVVRQ
jgi:carboxypeptidase C (cathepsin A)